MAYSWWSLRIRDIGRGGRKRANSSNSVSGGGGDSGFGSLMGTVGCGIDGLVGCRRVYGGSGCSLEW
eukprot:CAMPEP_0171315788 /NCGR_PEP_ID=MMETSP0816-20121228/67151_1 /TAXON_ID=420281 /ORGANISM="Proboscia inermis, Strain CCAP1064/1" /LENGTH=66 /DNA_ID=CAMNT_0011806849 /DNA_START=28 /DNA_END=225 /DNA_ORIENTATION=-